MAILNAGVSAESIGLGVSTSTAKSFGFCFYAGQDKTKTKRFWLLRDGKASACQPRTAHSRTVGSKLRKNLTQYKWLIPKKKNQ